MSITSQALFDWFQWNIKCSFNKNCAFEQRYFLHSFHKRDIFIKFFPIPEIFHFQVNLWYLHKICNKKKNLQNWLFCMHPIRIYSCFQEISQKIQKISLSKFFNLWIDPVFSWVFQAKRFIYPFSSIHSPYSHFFEDHLFFWENSENIQL